MKGEFLVLAHTPNDAKQIEALLRSAGHGVRVQVAPGLDSFSDIIAKSDISLAIHDADFRDCDLIQVVEAAGRSKPHLPILQLNPNSDPRSVTEAMSKGARAIISLTNPTHLEMMLQQEYEHHGLWGQIEALQSKIAELEDVRTQDLGTTAAPGMRIQEGIIVSANQALAQALNFNDPDDLIGYPLMDLVSSADQEQIRQVVKNCMKQRRGEDAVSFVLQGETGSKYKLDSRFIPIEYDGEPALEIRGLESLSPASASGETTFSRQALHQAIEKSTAAASPSHLISVVFVAVDHFEDIEQRVGYAGAEQVVDQAMKLLTSELLDSDQVFRFSVSEFVLVGHRESVDGLKDLIARYQKGLARHIFSAASKEISCTISAALSPMQAPAESPEELLRSIRKSVQENEAKGGNQLAIVGDTAQELEREKQSKAWIGRILQALKEDRFDLAYQNIASLAGEDRQFSDILLRMLDDNGQELLAREFLPTAEDKGLMPQIDRWVIRRATRVIEQQLKEYQDPCFFIRIAEGTLAEGEAFNTWLTEFMAEHKKAASHMVLVIRELHLQDHMKRAMNLIKTAKQLGISTALDHFGNTRQSPQLLSHLELDYVKLHADFTQEVSSSEGGSDQLKSIMQAARANKVKTIAERVADANSMARLWQLGVNYIMGSHVHEPDRELTNTRFRLN